MKSTRKRGEPIYLRRHMIALGVAVGLPVVLVQLYKLCVGSVSFGMQMGFAMIVSVLAGLVLYFLYRSSAQSQP